MKQLAAVLTALLLQASPQPPDGVPFEGAGTLIFASFTGGNRPPAADKDRAFETESGRLKKWLRIPAALDKDLQVGLYCWMKGIEKDGIVEPTEALVLPVESVLHLIKTPRPSNIAVRFTDLGGGCDHMPVIEGRVNCKPSFSGRVLIENDRKEPLTVSVERVFWSAKPDELGTTTDRFRAHLKAEDGLEPLPATIAAGLKRHIVLGLAMRSADCGDVRPHLTVLLKINGERVFVRGGGKYSISH